MASFSTLISSSFSISNNTPFSPFLKTKRHSHYVPIRANTKRTFKIPTYWDEIMSDVKVELAASIPSHSPKRMFETMHHAILSRNYNCLLSALLCVSVSELLGAPREAALPTAVTLEIFHAAIHAHKDFYSTETHEKDDKIHPSIGSIYGLDAALLSGQALSALGFQHIITKTSPHHVPHEILIRATMEIARSMGSTGIYAGLYLDLNGKSVIGEEEMMLVLEKKFGEMAGCSALCGGLIGGAKENELEALRRYGRTIGVLYEVRNEVSMESNGGLRKMKRSVGVVEVLGMERALEIVEELREKAEEELEMLGEKYGEKVRILYGFLDHALEINDSFLEDK